MLLTIINRAMWKDWGFAPSLFAQAKQFLDLAKISAEQEAHIRATIVFSIMAFEAYWHDLIRGFIQEKGARIPQQNVQEVEDQLLRSGINNALRQWPKLLVGKPLDMSTPSYLNFDSFRQYRNCLVHGNIVGRLPSGRLAQEVETIPDAELAVETVSDLVRIVATHFGFPVPTWSQ
jgi:hypothetical protein